MTTALVVLIIVLLLGGGWGYQAGLTPGHPYAPPGLAFLLIVVLILWLLAPRWYWWQPAQ